MNIPMARKMDTTSKRQLVHIPPHPGSVKYVEMGTLMARFGTFGL